MIKLNYKVSLILCVWISAMAGSILGSESILGSGSILGSESIQLTKDHSSYAFGKHVRVLKDPTHQLTINDVTQEEAEKKFQTQPREIINFGYNDSTYWFRFKVKNINHPASKWFLEIGYPALDHIEFYYFSNSTQQKKLGGDALPFSEWEVQYRNTVFSIPIKAGDQGTIYLKVKTNSAVQLPLNLYSPEIFSSTSGQSYLGYGGYFGLIFVMFLYNIFIFFSVRDKSYLFYVIYIAGVALCFLTLSGLMHQYVFPNNAWINDRSVPFGIGLSLVGALFFNMDFLQTKQRTPMLNMAQEGMFAVAFLTIIFSWLGPYGVAVRFGLFAAFFGSLLCIASGIILLIQGYRPARFYLLAWNALLIGVILRSMMTVGLLPVNFFTNHTIHIGSAIEMILLSLALADRINMIKQERQNALTAQLEETQKLTELTQQYQGIIENAAEGIFQADPSGKLLSANLSMARIFGYYSIGGVLKNVTSFEKFGFVDIQQIEHLKYILEKNGRITDFEAQILSRSGENRWISIFARAVKNDMGMTESYEGLLLDVTEKKMSYQMKVARDAAEQSAKAKSEFLANMSHEIRTPMNVILGLSGMLLKSDLEEIYKNRIEMINTSSQSLLKTINSILDFSKIESGKMKLELIHFNLEEILLELAKLLTFKTEKKNLELIFDIDTDVPYHLIGDPMRLGQVLVNLGANAVKFTESGCIIIKIERVCELNEHEISLKFSVEDTGIGIKEKNLTNLFDSFTQADSSTTRKYGGSGLGLAICDQIIELMGGKINIISQYGKGSTFYFTIKLGYQKEKHLKQLSEYNKFKNIPILLAAPTSLSSGVLRKALHSFSFKVNHVTTLNEVFQVLESPTDNRLMFIDHDLIRQNPPQFNNIIKHLKAKQHLPIIVLQPPFYSSEKENTQLEKEVDTILKPFNRTTLLNILQQNLEEKKSTDLKNTTSKNHTDFLLEQIKILLVEDNRMNQQIINDILTQRNISVDTVESGEEAIKRLEKENKKTNYDLILMDIELGGINGYKTTEYIRNTLNLKNIPILALTAHTFDEEKEKCFKVGMNDMITKPIELDRMLYLLKKWIRRKPICPPKIDINVKQSMPDIYFPLYLPGIDFENGLTQSHHNTKLLKKLLCDFYIDYQSSLEEIESALMEENFSLLKQRLHSIKGITGNFGAAILRKRIIDFETLLKSAKGREQLMVVFNDFKREFLTVLNSAQMVYQMKMESESKTIPSDPQKIDQSDIPKTLLLTLHQLLCEGNSEAEEQFEKLAPYLQTPQQRILAQQLKETLQNFDFEESNLILKKIASFYNLILDGSYE